MSGLDLREKLAKAIHDTDCDPDFVDLYETADPEPRQYAQNAADAAMKVFADWLESEDALMASPLPDPYGATREILRSLASTLKDQSHE